MCRDGLVAVTHLIFYAETYIVVMVKKDNIRHTGSIQVEPIVTVDQYLGHINAPARKPR